MNTQAAHASGDTTSLNFVDLAELCGYSVRSLRAYLQIGVLHPGVRQGREARFDQTHIDRLTQVGALRARGYTLSSIADLLETEDAKPKNENLAYARALVGSWMGGPKSYPTVAALEDSFPLVSQYPELVEAAVARGVASLDGSNLVVHQPEALQLGIDLIDNGIPIDVAVGEFDRLNQLLDPIVEQANAILLALHEGDSPLADFGLRIQIPHHVMMIGAILTKRLHTDHVTGTGTDQSVINLD